MIELRTLGGLDLRDSEGRELCDVLRQPRHLSPAGRCISQSGARLDRRADEALLKS